MWKSLHIDPVKLHWLPAVRNGLLVRAHWRHQSRQVPHQDLRFRNTRAQSALYLHAVHRGMVPECLSGRRHSGRSGDWCEDRAR